MKMMQLQVPPRDNSLASCWTLQAVVASWDQEGGFMVCSYFLSNKSHGQKSVPFKHCLSLDSETWRTLTHKDAMLCLQPRSSGPKKTPCQLSALVQSGAPVKQRSGGHNELIRPTPSLTRGSWLFQTVPTASHCHHLFEISLYNGIIASTFKRL